MQILDSNDVNKVSGGVLAADRVFASAYDMFEGAMVGGPEGAAIGAAVGFITGEYTSL